MYRQNQSTPARDQHNVRPPRAPERPLVPYMRFSRKMWTKIRQENKEQQIWDIGKIIAQMWRDAPEAEKGIYQHEYEIEKVEYEKAMRAYHNSSAYQQYMNAKNRTKTSEKSGGGGGGGLSAKKGGGVDASNNIVIQAVDEEDPYEMTGKRLSAIRCDRNNRLMADLFSASYVPDGRTLFQMARIEGLKKQGLSLVSHQAKLNEELNRLKETFNQRKRAIENASEEFEEKVKKIADDKPPMTEERYTALVDDWEKQLLKGYEEYKKRQAAIRARLEAERREAPVLYSLTCEKSPSPETKPESEKPAANSTQPPPQTAVAAAPVENAAENSVAPPATENNA